MGWANQLTNRQKVECIAWLAIGLALVGVIAWQAHLDNVAYETLNPEHAKNGWRPRHSAIETGLMMFAVFGASGSFGASVGALTRDQPLWTIAAIFTLPVIYIVLVNVLF